MATKPLRELRTKLSAQDMTDVRETAAIEIDKIRRVTRLDDLRKARALSQVQLAEELGSNQGAVSRIERQTDLHLSTLGRFIAACGGRMRIVVEFEGADPIELEMLSDIDGPRPRQKPEIARAALA
jgi:transcriptional regulator with XRE-family HTH domain